MKNYRKSQSPQTAGKWFTQLVGCAQIYHLRWYVRPSGSPADGRLPLVGNRGSYTSPAVQRTHLPFCVLPPLGDLKDKSPRGESFTGFSAGGVCL